MNAIKLELTEEKKFPTSQNIFFDGRLTLKDRDGNPTERDVRITVNPKWAGAYKEAVEKAERCKQPSFNLYVQNMERGASDYNGTGSTWARRIGDNGSLHQGNFNFQGHTYDLVVERGSKDEPFTLTLVEQVAASQADL